MFNYKTIKVMRKSENSANILLGFVAGAAAGAIAGILLAPDKGQATRQKVAQKASKLQDELSDSVQKGVEKLNLFKDSVFSLINKYAEETKVDVNEASNEPKD